MLVRAMWLRLFASRHARCPSPLPVASKKFQGSWPTSQNSPTPIQEGYSLGSDNRVGRFVRFPMQDSEQIYRLLGLIEGRSLSRASNRARGNQTLSQLA